MGRNSRRATSAAKADRHAAEVAQRLGTALRDARRNARLTQEVAAGRAGLSQATWSALENERDPRYTLATWDRAAFAVGTSLSAYMPETSAANLPRDSVHLKNQELIIRTAKGGGWQALPEEPIDRDVGRSRWGDVLLHRRCPATPSTPSTLDEFALMEVIDWFDDVGAPMRAWQRRLDAVERYAIARMSGDDPLPLINGCWIVRATRRNRQLVGEHENSFSARFPGSGHAWLAALTHQTSAMPRESALLWVSVNGERLFPSRLGP